MSGFEVNRADMRLLTECGFSGVLRNVDVDLAPIFEALETWMPDQGAGPIGRSLQDMVAGRFDDASERLEAVIASSRTGGNEARAILALVRAVRKDTAGAEEMAAELEGQGGSAEAFASLLTGGEARGTRGDDQRPVKRAAG